VEKKIFIEGMSCEHCVKHVTAALKDLSGVTKVEVDLAGKYAILDTFEDIKEEDIKTVVDVAGYEVTKIEAH
jgi:copper chaperone